MEKDFIQSRGKKDSNAHRAAVRYDEYGRRALQAAYDVPTSTSGTLSAILKHHALHLQEMTATKIALGMSPANHEGA